MKRIASIYLATGLAAFAGTSAPSIEEAITPPAENSGWRVRTALYGWAQSLEGDVTVRGINAPLDLKFEDLAEDLDMAVMGFVEVNHGRWGVLLDVNYAEISDSVPTPFGFIAPSIDFSMKQWLVNGYVTYNVFRGETAVFDVFAGARFNSVEIDLGINDENFTMDKSWVDPVAGLRFQQMLTRNLFFRAAGDIGGFGVSSDLTWQAIGSFGWKFNDHCSALIGYRFVKTDYESGAFGYDVKTHGPVLGLEFAF